MSIFVAFAVVHLVIVIVCWIFNLFDTRVPAWLNIFSSRSDAKLTSNWDIDGLEHELKKRVYGQDQAVASIMTILRTSHCNTNQPGHLVVFLIGGPGVGKSHILDIITNHLTWCSVLNNGPNSSSAHCCYCFQTTNVQYKSVLGTVSVLRKNHANFVGNLAVCDVTTPLRTYLKYPTNPDLADFLVSRINSYSNKRSLTFVTGSVISDRVASRLCQDNDDYTDFLHRSADRLEDYILKHRPNLICTIVVLEPLRTEHVARYLYQQFAIPRHVADEIARRETVDNFVPLGCKIQTRTYVNDVLVR